MAKYAVNSESLTAVADAIRAKTGGTDLLLFPDGMVEAIGGISGGGIGLEMTAKSRGGSPLPEYAGRLAFCDIESMNMDGSFISAE